MANNNYIEGVDSWPKFWNNYNSFLEELENLGYNEIANSLRSAKMKNTGFTDGWHNFLDGMKETKRENSHLKFSKEGEWLDQLIAYVEYALTHRN